MVLLDHLDVIRCNMKKINKEQMKKVTGGFNITASFITALVRGINSVMDVGRSLGTSIRRATSGKFCPL